MHRNHFYRKEVSGRWNNGLKGTCSSLVLTLGIAAAACMAQPAVARAASQSISIAAGPLDAAILELATRTGISVFVPPALAAGRTAPSIGGTMTPDQALGSLLRGSGLAYSRSRDGTYVIVQTQPKKIAAAFTPAASQVAPQSAAAAVPETAADNPAGDIVVTAQRRESSLSKTPVAVAVVSGDTLAKAQIVSEQDLRTATPGLTIKAGAGSNQLNYALRGQTVDPFSSGRPGVLPYFNEVQIGGPGAASAFYDLQSVQVLKGPQGTLFGRSATGGAVLFTSAQPTNDFGGYVSLLGGNYDAKKVEGALNVPIVDDVLLARVAGFWSERDGFQKNLFDGGRLGGYERYGLRGSVTVNTGALTNNLVVDYYHATGSNNQNIVTQAVPGGFPIGALYAGVATPQDRATGIATVQAFLGGANTPAGAAVPAFYDAYFAMPGHVGLGQFFAEQKARGPYKVVSDALTETSTKNLVITNKTSYEIGDNAQINNIIGYTRLKSFNGFDDGLPYGVAQNNFKGGNGRGVDNLTKQFSEELQFTGKTFDERLTYVVGGFFSDESYDQTNYFVSLDILLGGFVQPFHFRLKNRTYAGYAQGTYALNDNGLSFTLGGRYTSEKVRKLTLPDDANRLVLGDPAPAGVSYDKSRTFNKFSWAVGLQNQFDPYTLLYATTRRAYKSGGFNGAAPPLNGTPAQGGDSVEAEQVTDVELGLKYQNNAGGLPKRFNIAAFHNWVKNRQSIAFFLLRGAGQSATVNVPTAKVYGLEVDGSIGPVSGVTLGGSFNYTHAKFGSEPVNVPGPALLQYNQFPDTPKFSGSVFAEYAVPVTASIEAIFHGDVYAQSKTNTYVRREAGAGSTIPSYALVNFRIGLNDADAGWSLTANLKNAFDKAHYVGGSALGEVFGYNMLAVGDPRTFTLEARYKF
ncbi:TonB-dependent receptor [Sphingobium sp. AN558]|uniref:TonB-dependent receptor domain-containing protein n=1 Tax=Sphingobium sp. AN558 TaxID=3133442 RepID=UPI0030BF5E30